jgi:hypothetical protein
MYFNQVQISKKNLGGEILPNFNLKNMILTYTKDSPWEKMAQICQILKKNSNCQTYDKVQQVAKNIQGF